MAVKKRGRKTSSRRTQRKAVASRGPGSAKIKLTLTFLLATLILFVGAWIGYAYLFPSNELLGTFFLILTYLSGSLSLAFLIALLMFLVLKVFRK